MPWERELSEGVCCLDNGYPQPDQLQVFDITGRQVRLVEREPGTGIFFWDGISSSGDVLPPGTYVIRAVVGNESISMVVVRL
jgi:flagellar hook assembly protein FlgD